jgi:UDP-N-acetylmuramyl pentapeptide phosphotransferase/UDP-N-acetylglucosamine-1-phosphate transferase
MNMLWIFMWYAGCALAGRLVVGIAYNALLRGGHVRRNFQGRDIPTSVGVAFVLSAFIMAPFALLMLGRAHHVSDAFAVLALAAGFGVLGLIDDLTRTREKGGILGHTKNFLRTGHMSTALIKAGFGLVLCAGVLVLLRGSKDWPMTLVDTLILALSANAMNLLDVRPGRAVKGFLFALPALILISSVLTLFGNQATVAQHTLVLIVPFALWAFMYLPLDLKRKAMLGDAGSNVLGVIMGLALVWELSHPSRLAALGLLALFHVVCELKSLTEIIEKVPPLRWLDNLWVSKG